MDACSAFSDDPTSCGDAWRVWFRAGAAGSQNECVAQTWVKRTLSDETLFNSAQRSSRPGLNDSIARHRSRLDLTLGSALGCPPERVNLSHQSAVQQCTAERRIMSDADFLQAMAAPASVEKP